MWLIKKNVEYYCANGTDIARVSDCRQFDYIMVGCRRKIFSKMKAYLDKSFFERYRLFVMRDGKWYGKLS